MSTIDTAKVLLDERGQLLTKLSTERLKLIAQRDALLEAAKAAEPGIWILASQGVADSTRIHAQILAAIAACEE